MRITESKKVRLEYELQVTHIFDSTNIVDIRTPFSLFYRYAPPLSPSNKKFWFCVTNGNLPIHEEFFYTTAKAVVFQQGIASVCAGVNCYGSHMADCWKLRVCSLISTLDGAIKKLSQGYSCSSTKTKRNNLPSLQVLSLIWVSLGPLLTTSYPKKILSASMLPPIHTGGPAQSHCHPSICAAVALNYGHWPDEASPVKVPVGLGYFIFQLHLCPSWYPPLPLLPVDCCQPASPDPGSSNSAVNSNTLFDSDNISVNELVVFPAPVAANLPRAPAKTPPIFLAPTPPSSCLTSSGN